MKLPIDGLKIYNSLALIFLRNDLCAHIREAFHRLARQRINVNMLTLTATGGRWVGAGCISLCDLDRARAVLPESVRQSDIIYPVGMLTVFPHKSRTRLFFQLISAFYERRLALYATASATSTLSFIMDGHRLEQAAQLVQTIAELPSHHTPFTSRLHVRQL
ncbi:MAG: hypothetical protein GY874_07905 [Desulfobacteraceae bacterium]|nr:hypothetical protein [Desulfobacteraceae bacterium]